MPLSKRTRDLIRLHRKQCRQALEEAGLGIPAYVGSDRRIFQGSNDGFGGDNFSRQVAHERAEEAGLNVAGARYFPELVPEGGRVGHPDAWCWDKHDLEQKAAKLGVGIESPGFRVPAPICDIPTDQPYTVAEDVVQEEADVIVARQHDGKIKLDDYDQLCHDIREKRSGRGPGDDEE